MYKLKEAIQGGVSVDTEWKWHSSNEGFFLPGHVEEKMQMTSILKIASSSFYFTLLFDKL